jgi:hypothetical protein
MTASPIVSALVAEFGKHDGACRYGGGSPISARITDTRPLGLNVVRQLRNACRAAGTALPVIPCRTKNPLRVPNHQPAEMPDIMAGSSNSDELVVGSILGDE